jgi:hypothetical protein
MLLISTSRTKKIPAKNLYDLSFVFLKICKKFDMKKTILLLLWASVALSQHHQRLEYTTFTPLSQNDSARLLGLKAGLVNIDGKIFYGFRFQSEFAIKKMGIGVDIPLLFDVETGRLRADEYYYGIGALRLIRYFRYGRKKLDPFYIRLGDITGTYLGYGLLVNNYSNSISFERRKFGLTFDVLIRKKYGLEGFYSDLHLTSFNLLGLRPYFRPFGQSKLPIINSLEIGAAFVLDRDKNPVRKSAQAVVPYEVVSQGMSGWSFDVGFDVINTSFLRLSAYVQAGGLMTPDTLRRSVESSGKSFHEGRGAGLGLASRLNIIENEFVVDARMERVWFSDFFLPQFFDVGYEINKDLRIMQLGSVRSQQGIFGAINGTLMKKVHLGGSFLLPDNLGFESPGMLQLHARSTQPIAQKITLQAHYIKSPLRDLESVFYIDERSQMSILVGYNISKYFVVGVHYRWTFARLADGDVKATSMVTPYFGLSVPLGKN